MLDNILIGSGWGISSAYLGYSAFGEGWMVFWGGALILVGISSAIKKNK